MDEFEYIIVENLTVARCILAVLKWHNYDNKTEGDFEKIEVLAARIREDLEKRVSCEG